MKSTTNTLASRAMLATLSITGWSGTKLDKAATLKTTADAGAIADAARVNKRLLAGQDGLLKDIGTISSAARAEYYRLAMPWNDNGQRLIPLALWADLNSSLQSLQARHAGAVAAFLDDYDSARARAQANLSGLFRADDYPPTAKVAAKFSFSFHFDPVPTAPDFRADLGDEQAAMLAADIESRAAERYAQAIREPIARMSDVIRHIADTLPKFEREEVKRFNDSLITNVRDLLAILPAMNITDDPAISRLIDACRPLAAIEPQTLRDSAPARHAAAEAAADVLSMMAAHLGAPAPLIQPMPEAFSATPCLIYDLFAAPARAA
jgi:hypothetical protein